MRPPTPGDPPTISGHLGTISVQDVMGFLTTLSQGGALEVHSPDGELTLYLDDGGDVVGGRMARGRGAAPGGLAAEELYEAIFRLFNWTPGDFRFYEGRTPPPAVQPVRIEVRSLLLEAARHCDEWSALPPLYSDPETRFELRAEPRDDERVSLDLDEWRLLYLVTNRRRLAEIWEQSPLGSRLETSRTLFGLASARLIQPLGDKGSRLAEEALSPPSSGRTPPVPADLEPPTLAPPAGDRQGGDAEDPALDTQPVVPAPPKPGSAAFGGAGEGGTLQLARSASGELTRPSRRLTRSQIRLERAARLVQIVPGGERRVFPLAGDRVTLGRARDNHLILADGHVSGHHARLIREGDRFVIVDTHSSNGVRVNGRPVFRATLEGGEEIEIYPYHFRFEVAFEVFESA